MSDTIVIVNPAAGAGRVAREWQRTAATLREAGLDFEERFTTAPNHATELAREAVRAGKRAVVALGGDGTLNEVANGFFQDGEAIPTSSALGLLPYGTGGDTKRTFGIPIDIGTAARVIMAGNTRSIDAGRVRIDGRVLHFINIAEAGLGADVSDRVNRAPKVLGGKLSFGIGALTAIAGWKHRQMKVVVDGEAPRDLLAQAVTIANCEYYGGGMRVAPMAVPDDGLFDVIITGALGKLEGIQGMSKIYAGTHFDDPKLKLKLEHLRGRRVVVSSTDLVLVQVEGEVVGRLPATFEMMPGALRLLVPA